MSLTLKILVKLCIGLKYTVRPLLISWKKQH